MLCCAVLRECVWLFSILSHSCDCFTTLSLPLLHLSIQSALKVSTIAFCSSIKSLLYRVLVLYGALLLHLAFLLYFFELHALYYKHCACFCKQLCSFDRSIERSVCIWFWRLPFTIGIVTFAHTLYISTLKSAECFFRLFSLGWKWEKMVLSMIWNFSIMELLFPFEKLLCSHACVYLCVYLCVYVIAGEYSMYIWIH